MSGLRGGDTRLKLLFVLGALAAWASEPGLAQVPFEPDYQLAVSAGLMRGGVLWRLPRQFLPVAPDGVDSLALARASVWPMLSVGISFTRFGTEHLGLTADLRYIGLRTRSSCSALGPFSRDSLQLDQTACAVNSGRIASHQAVAFQAGVTLRSNRRGGSWFYLRALAGAALLGSSLTNVDADVAVRPAGDTSSNSWPLLRVSLVQERQSASVTWIVSASAGARIPLGGGLSGLIEVADVVMGLPVPSGSSGAVGGAGQSSASVGTSRRVFQFPTMFIGVDFGVGSGGGSDGGRKRRY